MKMKSVIVVGLAMMSAAVFAGEKIAPDLGNLAPEWKLTSAKVMEEEGQNTGKFFDARDIVIEFLK
ncbi:MAG: hypothetical protein WCS96_04585 [Victivallales bacterium]|jgi:hypothetical protein